MRPIIFKAWLLGESNALGHTKLTYPLPRDPNSNGGNKTGPCGPFAKAGVTATFTSGSNITINWTETINHPGRFLFSLSSSNDTAFQNFATYVDTQNTSGSHTNSATFTLPNIVCDSCTMQLVQSMEENPAAPTYYYSCADVKITAGTATATPTTTGTPESSVTTQSSQASSSTGSQVAEGSKFGGGCGIIAKGKSSTNFSRNEFSVEGLVLLAIPILAWFFFRRVQVKPSIKRIEVF